VSEGDYVSGRSVTINKASYVVELDGDIVGQLVDVLANVLEPAEDIVERGCRPEVLLLETELFTNCGVIPSVPLSLHIHITKRVGKNNSQVVWSFGYKTDVIAAALFELSIAFS
jgi:Na+-transporting NADH:ubiquinone oxidoreductase subunit NqrA